MKASASLIAGVAVAAALAAGLLPVRHRATLEVAPGNHIQHIRVSSRSLLGVSVAPWGLRLEGCPAWGGGAQGLFFAPERPCDVRVRAWPSLNQVFATAPSGDGSERQPLRDEGEREALRRWFVAILEQQLDGLSPAWEPAQRDCAGLLRFAYREAWAPHDEAWRRRVGFTQPFQGRSPSSSPGPGPWRNALAVSFLTDDGWNPFARGAQLRIHNCVFLGREVAAGKPGDLLFFTRPGATQAPDHAMALVRPDGDGTPVLIYHTGPDTGGHAGSDGEVRRVRLDELMQHPNPDFRPHPDNPAFLGVYRWNALAEENL